MIDNIQVIALVETDDSHLMKRKTGLRNELLCEAVIGHDHVVSRAFVLGLNSIARKIAQADECRVAGLQDLSTQLGWNRADEVVGSHLLCFYTASGPLELWNIIARRQTLDIALVKLLSNTKEVVVELFGFAPFDSLRGLLKAAQDSSVFRVYGGM